MTWARSVESFQTGYTEEDAARITRVPVRKDGNRTRASPSIRIGRDRCTLSTLMQRFAIYREEGYENLISAARFRPRLGLEERAVHETIGHKDPTG